MKNTILNCLAIAAVSATGYSQDLGSTKTKSEPKTEYKYKIEDLKINSKFSDFAPITYAEKLIFASVRKDSSNVQTKMANAGNSTADLYVSDINNLAAKPKVFYTNADTQQFNELSACIVTDGNTMYFTANNVENGVIKKDARGVNLLKIYRATLEGDQWKNITDLSINDNGYNTAYPALSPDGKMLYFSSNMPGSVGQSDLYRVSIDAVGNFGTPENLGSKINTKGMELFPYVDQDNVLYFASNGLDGFGGLDVYMSRINADGSLEAPENLGKGFNSAQDDFSLIIDAKGKGYFASNRNGGAGEEDIYAFTRTPEGTHEETAKVAPKANMLTVRLVYTQEGKADLIPAQFVNVELYDERSRLLKEQNADFDGKVNFEYIPGKVYKIKSSYSGYESAERLLSKTDTAKIKEFEILFKKKDAEPVEPVNLTAEKITPVKTKAKTKGKRKTTAKRKATSKSKTGVKAKTTAKKPAAKSKKK